MGLHEGERCFSKSTNWDGRLDIDSFFCSITGDVSITGDFCTSTLSSNKRSSDLLGLDKGIFVNCPESRLSEGDAVRCDNLLVREGLSFRSLLSGDLDFLDDDFLLGDLRFSSEALLFFTGKGECLFGDLLLLGSEERLLCLRGDRLLDNFLFLDDGESLLDVVLLETGERLFPLLLGGEMLLFRDLLLDL